MKLNYKKTLLIGFAFLSICTFWQMYDNEIPLILEHTFHLNATVIGAIMALDNVLAVVMLPVFGSLSDKTNNVRGKRMPFIIVGTLAASVLLILLALANQWKSLVMFIIVLFLLLVAMGSYRSPAVSLMPDVTPKPLRSKANAIINLMGTVGGIIALILIPVLVRSGDTPNYLPLFCAIAGVMLVSLGILLKFVDENKLRTEREEIDKQTGDDQPEQQATTATGKLAGDVKKSMLFLLASVALWFFAYNAVTTAFSRYYQDYWGLADKGYTSCLMVGTVAAVIAYIPAGWLAGKLGRKKTIMTGVVILGLSFLAGCMFSHFTFAINIVFATVGIGWAMINVNSYPMVVEMSQGSNIGKFTGFYYTASMAAQVVTPILSGFLIDKIGYQSLFPYATLFAALALITMTQVKHGDSKPIPPASKLESFADHDN